MIIKTKHGFFLTVGILVGLCLCCLAGIVIYLALFANLHYDTGTASNKTVLHNVKPTDKPRNAIKNNTAATSTEHVVVIENNDNETVILDVIDFSDEWNYRISPHKEPLLGERPQKHDLPPTASPRKGKAPSASTEIQGSLRELEKKLGDSVRSKISCSTCRLGVGLLHAEVRKRTPFEAIKVKFVSICVTFKIQIESVCSGIFDVFGPEVLPALNVTKIGATEICALLVGESCGEVPNPLHEWEVTFPPVPKPQVVETNFPKSNSPVFKVLQISDTHYDPQYVEGSIANCQEPLCCRSHSTPPENGSTPIVLSGKWGAYEKCDMPKISIDNAFQDILTHHPDVDYIIWTGDLPPHDIWNQTKAQSLEILKDTVEQMFNAFPNIPIFPALGNHESIPAGNFPPPWSHEPDHSINWLYTEVAKEWSKWLPESSKNTMLHGGFYSVLIRPGFRLISLNMNYCHTISWWLYVNSTDPARELQWLIYELQEAENSGEKVHIIGHIPPGQSDCMRVWSRNYYSIIDRYESTVVAQFFGHTHQDEFEVFYDTKNHNRPTSIAYVGSSITTFENNNPGYRVYYVDGDHNETMREVIDFETWILDLEEANNSTETPSWNILYSARSAFGMQTLKPADWSDMIQRMAEDQSLFDLFYRFYYRDSPTRPPCDTNECKLQILCDQKSGKSHERHQLCHDLELLLPD